MIKQQPVSDVLGSTRVPGALPPVAACATDNAITGSMSNAVASRVRSFVICVPLKRRGHRARRSRTENRSYRSRYLSRSGQNSRISFLCQVADRCCEKDLVHIFTGSTKGA
jgi:hypothetical protein